MRSLKFYLRFGEEIRDSSPTKRCVVKTPLPPFTCLFTGIGYHSIHREMASFNLPPMTTTRPDRILDFTATGKWRQTTGATVHTHGELFEAIHVLAPRFGGPL